MLSPKERTAWSVVAVVLLAALVAAWWNFDRWAPQAEPWARKAWLTITRPPPLEPGQAGKPIDRRRNASANAQDKPLPVQPRKCVQGSRTTYTDQTCPAGSTEHLMEPERVAVPQ